MSALHTLVVFSHLRWSFVYQRPQHLMTRLAGHWRILFIEEPVPVNGLSRLEVRHVAPDLTVLVPQTELKSPGFHDDHLATLQGLISAYLEQEGIRADVAWLYTPMALPLAQALDVGCLVYDCMDELSAFKDAPRQLRQRESALLTQAALVLTGGPSLFEARRHRHPNVHCFPSAVDAAHFSPDNLVPGCNDAVAASELQDHLPHPRLGYFGVIDERFDADLVALLADRHPEWQLVMVGPVVKISPASLPQRPNIHWLGMQAYERLPYLLAGWDLCLLPFALNEATRFISPTKTLEYMAGNKPVVSTPVRDVMVLYGEAVQVAPAGEEFVRSCETLLAERGEQRRRRAEDMLGLVFRSSWDRSALVVHALLLNALIQTQTQEVNSAMEGGRRPADVRETAHRAPAFHATHNSERAA